MELESILKRGGRKERQGSTRQVRAFVLLAMASFELGIISAQGSGVIYIRPDGTINPSSAPISTNDTFNYRLTGKRARVSIDGSHKTVQGTGGGYGLTLNSISGISIRDINVRSFARAKALARELARAVLHKCRALP